MFERENAAVFSARQAAFVVVFCTGGSSCDLPRAADHPKPRARDNTAEADEGKNDEAARHLALADAVIDPLPEHSALIKWQLQNLRIHVLLKLNRLDEALQHLKTIKTPLTVSRAAAEIAAHQIKNGQVEAGLKTAERIGTERGFGDDRGRVAISLFEHGDRNIAEQYINQVDETDEAMNVLNTLARHWVEAGDTARLQSTFDSINSPTARTHYATSAAVFLTSSDVKNAKDMAK